MAAALSESTSNQCLRVLVNSIEGLSSPQIPCSSSDCYVMVTHGDHKGTTHNVPLAGASNINTEFNFPFVKNAPVQFQVIEASQKAIVADGVRYTDAESKYDASKLDAQKLFSFPWKGTIQLHPHGTLTAFADLIDTPANPPSKATVVIRRGRHFLDSAPKEACVVVSMEHKCQKTKFVKRNADQVYVWEETFEFDYANEHRLSVNFYGRNDEKKPYAMAQYDLWAMQLDKIGKITGDLVITDSTNKVMGTLQVSVRLWNPGDDAKKTASRNAVVEGPLLNNHQLRTPSDSETAKKTSYHRAFATNGIHEEYNQPNSAQQLSKMPQILHDDKDKAEKTYKAMSAMAIQEDVQSQPTMDALTKVPPVKADDGQRVEVGYKAITTMGIDGEKNAQQSKSSTVSAARTGEEKEKGKHATSVSELEKSQLKRETSGVTRYKDQETLQKQIFQTMITTKSENAQTPPAYATEYVSVQVNHVNANGEMPAVTPRTFSRMAASAARILVYKAAVAAREARHAATATLAVANVYKKESAFRRAEEARIAAEKAEEASRNCEKELSGWIPLTTIPEAAVATLALLVKAAKLEKANAKAALHAVADEEPQTLNISEYTSRKKKRQDQQRTHQVGSSGKTIPATLRDDTSRNNQSKELQVPILSWRQPANPSTQTDTIIVYNPGKQTVSNNPSTNVAETENFATTGGTVVGSSVISKRFSLGGLEEDVPQRTCCGFAWTHY